MEAKDFKVSDAVAKDSVIDSLPGRSATRNIEEHTAWIEGLRVAKPKKGPSCVACRNGNAKMGCVVPFLLAVSMLVVGVVSFAEEVNPKVRWPTLPQLRGNPRSRPSTAHVQGWNQAVKEAEAKFNCVFKPSYAYGVDGKWNAGEGKSYIFDSADGTYLKFDENGRLVKAGNRGDFEEIQWTYKRAYEISQELQQKMQQELQRKRETPNGTVSTTNLNERQAK